MHGTKRNETLALGGVALALLLAVPLLVPPAAGAPAGEEAQQLAVLASQAPLYEKTRACHRLALIGTREAVPALAALLGDAQLGDYARLALEPLADPAVDAALRAAAEKLEGRPLTGVVNALGVRRDAAAVPVLRAVLAQPARGAAPEALAALGGIGTEAAAAVLLETLAQGPAAWREATAHACVTAAERLAVAGRVEPAAALCEAVRRADVPESLRMAATLRFIAVRGADGVSLLVELLRSGKAADTAVALRAARDVPGPAVTQALAGELGRAQPELQRLLLTVLRERADPAARAAIAGLAEQAPPAVRVEALHALGELGDASVVPVLVRALGTAGDVGAAAGASLRGLKAEGTDAALLAALDKAEGVGRVPLIELLCDRRCAAAIPALLAVVHDPAAPAAGAAWKALGRLAGPAELPALLAHIVAGRAGAHGELAESALCLAAARNPVAASRADPVLAAYAAARDVAARQALLRILGRIAGDKACDVVVRATGDGDPAVRDTAVRLLADWPDARPAEALLKLAQTSTNETHRVLALRGTVRVLGLAGSAPAATQVRSLDEVLRAVPGADSKRLVLAAVANIRHADALALAVRELADPAVRAEAATAAVALGRGLALLESAAVREAMARVGAAAGVEAAVAQAAGEVARQAEAVADRLMAWRIAGPYLQAGKGYAALFDVVFEPETAEPAQIAWQAPERALNPAHPGLVDLLGALGGEQRVAYAQTWVHVDAEQRVVLDLGSDDGVKAWLNGRLVHANNVARAAQPFTDRAEVTLQAGWNRLLLKITQNNLGWEFCARMRTPAGQPVPGLRADQWHGDSASPNAVPPGL